MRIGLNVDFDTVRMTGVSRYGLELAAQLDGMGQLTEIWMNRDAENDPGPFGEFTAPVLRFPPLRRITDPFWPAMRARRAGLDAVVSPAGRLLPGEAFTQAAMIHDLGPYLLPEMKNRGDTRTWRGRIADTVGRASMIMVNSRSTLDDLLHLFPEVHDRVAVTPLGIDHFRRSRNSGAGKHLLAVGTIDPRKNYLRLIEAYAALAGSRPDTPPLVIAGMDGYMSGQVHRLPEELGMTSRVIFTGYVGERELLDLYRDAACLVHPAIMEGFGFTVPEAFAWDLPVAASRCSSLEEYYRDAVHLFDPENPLGMRDALARCIDEGVTEEQRIEREALFERLTWRRCAELTLSALEKVVV